MRTTLAILLWATAAHCAVPGIDVTGLESNINWNTAKANGKQFAYLLATRSTTYLNPFYHQQRKGATTAGLFQGAYHLAEPSSSDGTSQANFFLDKAGEWHPGGSLLPGAVALEKAPGGDMCWGKHPSAMVDWIQAFSTTYKKRTGRYPVIFTTTEWWNQCTRSNNTFGGMHPLWLERHQDAIGPLPAGWKFASIWQNTDNAGKDLGAGDIWSGDAAGLKKFAATA